MSTLMPSLTFALFNGLLYGMTLFLISSGFTLIFGVMGILNLAHASFFMIGAYLAYQLVDVLGFLPTLVIAPALTALLGVGVERFLLRRVRGGGHTSEILVTFGLSYILSEAVQLIWGRTPVPYQVPAMLDFTLFAIGGIHYSAYNVFAFAITVAVFIAVYCLFRISLLGLVIRAALTKPLMVAALGHDVPRLTTQLFALGTALAALGGVLTGNILGTQPSMALHLGTLVFVVVVVGGLGSLSGALLVSLAIGVMQTIAVTYPISAANVLSELELARLPMDVRVLSSASIAPLLPYLLMVFVLLVRPRGLFGTREA